MVSFWVARVAQKELGDVFKYTLPSNMEEDHPEVT